MIISEQQISTRIHRMMECNEEKGIWQVLRREIAKGAKRTIFRASPIGCLRNLSIRSRGKHLRRYQNFSRQTKLSATAKRACTRKHIQVSRHVVRHSYSWVTELPYPSSSFTFSPVGHASLQFLRSAKLCHTLVYMRN